MRISLTIIALFAAACADVSSAPADSSQDPSASAPSDNSGDAPVQGDDDDAGIGDYDVDLGGDGWVYDDSGNDDPGDEPPEWYPANLREGIWSADMVEIYDDHCGGSMTYPDSVVMNRDDQTFLMWGVAPVLTDGEIIRAVGQHEAEYTDRDCVRVSTIQAGGFFTGPLELTFDVRQTIEYFGSECTEFEQNACGSAYRATYAYSHEFEQGDQEPID